MEPDPGQVIRQPATARAASVPGGRLNRASVKDVAPLVLDIGIVSPEIPTYFRISARISFGSSPKSTSASAATTLTG